MIAATLLTLAIVTQDQATLRAAPRDAAPQQAALWQGDALEIRGQRMDYLQVYDHRRERAGFVHISQVQTVSLKPADASELLSVVRFLRDRPGAEALGMAYTAAYLKAAPAEAIGAEPFDALGTMADRLARRASMKHAKAVSDVISAHMEVAASYGVTFKGYEREGAMQLCYNGEAFRRVLALPSDAEQRARAALSLTRHDCMRADMHPQDRLVHDQWRAEVLDKVSDTQFAQLPEISKNRLRLRRAGVHASLAFQQARRAELPTAAAQRSLAELAGVNKTELTDNDQQEYSDAAIRVGASRWAAETARPKLAKLTVLAEAGQAGETCVALFENKADGKPGKDAAAKRCTYGIVWTASASAHPNGQALALAVQPLDSWRELWVFRKTAGQWSIDVLPPSSSGPELGYIEFAGWARGTPNMLLVRETRIAGRIKRSFEVARMDTLTTEKQASQPGMLAAFGKGQDAAWKRQTVSLR
ncbi:hypothetical protein [Polaromonas sp. A23]|uniref:hypothetical protein n=1 Tax=Polaromonas sp. A23 TaxID=1944133 RepID=UPI000986EE6D|nr:hypothetical protein [Polaromonas sp. A23]OOG43817.1 hypothetical protein B0B52_07775 [Polaromonas sp. A23]